MRKLKAIIVSLLTAWGVYAADITPITNALKSGDAAALAGNMYTETDIAVPGAAQKGSPAEAGAILSRFFQGNTPSGFTVVHTSGREYRVNITYIVKDGRALIQTIRIE